MEDLTGKYVSHRGVGSNCSTIYYVKIIKRRIDRPEIYYADYYYVRYEDGQIEGEHGIWQVDSRHVIEILREDAEIVKRIKATEAVDA